MRPYIEGEDLKKISIAYGDVPTPGGMVAINPDDPMDRWYIREKFFQKHYEPMPE